MRSTADPPVVPERPYATAALDVASGLGVAGRYGLATDEAQRRGAHFGPNALVITPPPGFWTLLVRQFQSLLILILLVAAAISFVAGDPQDTLVILGVVGLNALIGATQEARAERALASLQHMSAPSARVVRDGEEQHIPARDVVPGDVVLVRAGDLVPADGRLLTVASLQIDESALTGESVPVEKDADAMLPPATSLADRTNMVFLGTAVTFGHGRLVVTATGGATEMGRIARSATEAGLRATPLEQQVAWLGKALSLLALGACAVIFALGLLRGQAVGEMFLVAMSLAVAAVPEGLPAVVTIVLAMGVQRMAQRNAIVRRLASVEALGAATVICTDKTGTLTLGQMRVAVVLVGGRLLDVVNGELREQGLRVTAEDVPGLAGMLRAAVLCNNARLEATPVGDPTEQALLYWAQAMGTDRAAVEHTWPRVSEIPFSSDRKRMTTVHQRAGATVAFTKGAPDAVLADSTTVLTLEGTLPLLSEGRTALHAAITDLAAQGLRVLALAQRTLDFPGEAAPGEAADTIEDDLTFLGVVGLLDPPRPEVPAALASARSAGIRVVMITGDHPATAGAIAGRLGITGRTVTGADMERMDAGALEQTIATAAVYARVAPQQKVEIVQAFQGQGNVVAMTGDGANDAPALRLADIGVAMGIRGTQVAKDAAAMVLVDDNFATIVAAVEEGRTIYANLRKVVLYLLAGNLGEVLVIFLAMLAGMPLPLQAAQILWINLLTDALPALGLGMEPREPGTMEQPPRAPGEPFLPLWTVPLIVVPSVLLALVTLLAFAVGLRRAPDDLAAAQSAAFVTLVLAHLGIGWAQRSTTTPVLALLPRSNSILIAAILGGVGLLLPLLYTGPGQALFHTRPLDVPAWGLALLLTPIPLLGTDAVKVWIARRRGPRAR